MTGPIVSRKREQQRRGVVHRHLVEQGYPARFIEQMVLRMRRHDDLRRARAVVQALDGYRHVAR